MALAPGTKLGPYEVQSPLGAGGMGEVYRARDTRLDHIVAIKILSTHLSESAEIKQRFEREARAISSRPTVPRCSTRHRNAGYLLPRLGRAVGVSLARPR